MKKGDYLWIHFDNGIGGTILYGVVEAAGPVTFTVCWESGLRNRLRQDEVKAHCITVVKREELDEWARKNLDREMKR